MGRDFRYALIGDPWLGGWGGALLTRNKAPYVSGWGEDINQILALWC